MKEKEILQLTYILEEIGKIEFEHNNLFYEIFESAESGYMINIYSSNEKDDDGGSGQFHAGPFRVWCDEHSN